MIIRKACPEGQHRHKHHSQCHPIDKVHPKGSKSEQDHFEMGLENGGRKAGDEVPEDEKQEPEKEQPKKEDKKKEEPKKVEGLKGKAPGSGDKSYIVNKVADESFDGSMKVLSKLKIKTRKGSKTIDEWVDDRYKRFKEANESAVKSMGRLKSTSKFIGKYLGVKNKSSKPLDVMDMETVLIGLKGLTEVIDIFPYSSMMVSDYGVFSKKYRNRAIAGMGQMDGKLYFTPIFFKEKSILTSSTSHTMETYLNIKGKDDKISFHFPLSDKDDSVKYIFAHEGGHNVHNRVIHYELCRRHIIFDIKKRMSKLKALAENPSDAFGGIKLDEKKSDELKAKYKPIYDNLMAKIEEKYGKDYDITELPMDKIIEYADFVGENGDPDEHYNGGVYDEDGTFDPFGTSTYGEELSSEFISGRTRTRVDPDDWTVDEFKKAKLEQMAQIEEAYKWLYQISDEDFNDWDCYSGYGYYGTNMNFKLSRSSPSVEAKVGEGNTSERFAEAFADVVCRKDKANSMSSLIVSYCHWSMSKSLNGGKPQTFKEYLESSLSEDDLKEIRNNRIIKTRLSASDVRRYVITDKDDNIIGIRKSAPDDFVRMLRDYLHDYK